MNRYIKDLYPTKGQFRLKDGIGLIIELTEAGIEVTENLQCQKALICKMEVLHFDKVIYESSFAMSSSNSQEGTMSVQLPAMSAGGYGVSLTVCLNDEVKQTITRAFDVASDHKKVPRYGFLSDFTAEDGLDQSDVISMTKLHINIVQFYDWMYRHETLVSEENHYADLMGKVMSKTTIEGKIGLCKAHGMATMAYGAIYAASKPFFEAHEGWASYDSNNKPITFIDIFYIMNVEKRCGWHEHIVSEYEKAVTELGFDGIHMDTYGFPKTAYDAQGHQIALDEAFPALIESTKHRLNNVERENTVIFNNVGNWPVYATANTSQDIMYVEVWEPYVTYEHIQRIILEAAMFTDKPMIISAYLKPFMTDKQIGADYALKLMTACVCANGATHLIMGEHQKVLTQGYYVDHYDVDDALFDAIRKYYDFLVRYAEILFDKSLRDVSMTHAYGDNQEYVFEGIPTSAYGEAGKVWTIIRENTSMKLVSLVNLVGNNNLWNEAKNRPVSQRNLTIKIQLSCELEGAYIMTPENPSMKEIPCEEKEGERGKFIQVNVDEIDVWTLIVVKTIGKA